MTITATPFVWRDPRTIPRRQWLYGRHYIRKYTSATFAPGGLGKSSLTLAEALAMTTALPLLGVRSSDTLRVWCFNGEDPLEEVERRVFALCLHHGVGPDDIGGRLFLDSGRQTKLIIAERLGDGTKVVRPVVDALIREIRARKVDVVIIDPFVSCHSVPENDNNSIDQVAKAWVEIAEATGCSIELVHHVRKAASGQTSYSVEDARGGSALLGAVRSARVLNGMTAEEAEQAEVPPAERRRFFRVDCGKSNMSASSDHADWHELVSVGLDNGDSGGPEDLVGVVTAWTMPGLFDAVQIEDTRKVQAAIAAGTWAESVQAGNGAGHAIAQVLSLDAESAPGKKRVRALLKVWIESGALRVDRQHDARNGRTKPMIVVGVKV